jgi:hypothetical protein
MLLIVQTVVTFFLYYYGKFFLIKTIGTCAATVRRWANRAHMAFSLGTAVLFAHLAVDLYTSGTSGWVSGLQVQSVQPVQPVQPVQSLF